MAHFSRCIHSCKSLYVSAVAMSESAWERGFPLFQRGIEGDLATFTSAAASEIPPSPPLKKGGVMAHVRLGNKRGEAC